MSASEFKVSKPLLTFLVESMGPCPQDPLGKMHWQSALGWYAANVLGTKAPEVMTPGGNPVTTGGWGSPKPTLDGLIKPKKPTPDLHNLMLPDPDAPMSPDWLLLTVMADDSHVIPAIKLLCTLTKCGLKEAKDAIDTKSSVPCPQIALTLYAQQVAELELKGVMFVATPCPLTQVPGNSPSVIAQLTLDANTPAGAASANT